MSKINLHPVAELMPEPQFWQIIDATLQAAARAGHASDQAEGLLELQPVQKTALEDALRPLGWQELLKFQNRFDALHAAAYRSHLWCAAYLINGGCSDDGFTDFRTWLISRGQQLYTAALANPDEALSAALVTDEPDFDSYGFEDFTYGLPALFAQLCGTDEDAFYDNRAGGAREPELAFDWQEDDEDSMRRICPRLFAHQIGDDEDDA